VTVRLPWHHWTTAELHGGPYPTQMENHRILGCRDRPVSSGQSRTATAEELARERWPPSHPGARFVNDSAGSRCPRRSGRRLKNPLRPTHHELCFGSSKWRTLCVRARGNCVNSGILVNATVQLTFNLRGPLLPAEVAENKLVLSRRVFRRHR